MKRMYSDFESIPAEHMQEAADKAYWFADGGRKTPTNSVSRAKILDWEQDKGIIFPTVNKAAGCETRALPYLHWWSFLGYFGEIGEGLFSQVIHIAVKNRAEKSLKNGKANFSAKIKSLLR